MWFQQIVAGLVDLKKILKLHKYETNRGPFKLHRRLYAQLAFLNTFVMSRYRDPQPQVVDN